MNILPILTTIFGTLIGFAYFLQTYKIFKRKSAKDISIITYIFFIVGVVIWLIYGISISKSLNVSGLTTRSINSLASSTPLG